MTDKENANEYALLYCARNCTGNKCDTRKTCERYKARYSSFLAGLEAGRKEKETIIGAMETIKNYCIEISNENGNCKKCVFCSRGYNGCKLQTSPNNWELAEV